MSNKLSFAKSDKIKILPVEDKGWEKVDLATPIGIIEVNGEYKAKRYTAGTEFAGILASKYIPFQELYVEPIEVGTVYTVRIEGAVNLGDTLAPVEDGYFQAGDGNLKVVKKINNEIVEAVGISTGNGGGGGQTYTLPIASATRLGGVKIGDNLEIDNNGVLKGTATYDDTALKKMITDETAERIAKDTELENKKADKTDLEKEIQDRKDADDVLDKRIDKEIVDRETEDTKLDEKIKALKKIYVWATGLEVKANDLIIHADKVYIVREDMTLTTWDADEPKLTLTDSNTISCVDYKENIKIEKGQLVIYNKQLYICDTSIDNTTDWDTDKDKMILTSAEVDLNDYYNKKAVNDLLLEKQDKLTAGEFIDINQNTIKVVSSENADVNTLAKRTDEGVLNVGTPAVYTDTTAINNKKLTDELEKKQDKLTAGANIEIDTNNTINTKDIYTKAEVDAKITEEKTARETKDTELEGKITTNTNNLNTEITNRTNADTTLQNNIDNVDAKFGEVQKIVLTIAEQYASLSEEDKQKPILYIVAE